MSKSREAIEEAIAMEAEVAENVEAAQAEQQRGASGVSLGLLIEALQKERDGLDLADQGIESLRQSLEERRRALEQQEEILNQLIAEMNRKKR
jgi:mannose/fructose-specific phosphotransferase system component IIA